MRILKIIIPVVVITMLLFFYLNNKDASTDNDSVTINSPLVNIERKDIPQASNSPTIEAKPLLEDNALIIEEYDADPEPRENIIIEKPNNNKTAANERPPLVNQSSGTENFAKENDDEVDAGPVEDPILINGLDQKNEFDDEGPVEFPDEE